LEGCYCGGGEGGGLSGRLLLIRRHCWFV
jgi:hypothetical protein